MAQAPADRPTIRRGAGVPPEPPWREEEWPSFTGILSSASPRQPMKVSPPLRPAQRDAVTAWLQRILNPDRMPSSRARPPEQVFSRRFDLPSWAPFSGDNPELDLALRQVGQAYPQALQRSPTISVPWIMPAPPGTDAMFYRQGGHIAVNRRLLPDDADDSEVWRRKMQYLRSTLGHELSHGMGLHDVGLTPTAYDVNDAMDMLQSDIRLESEEPEFIPRSLRGTIAPRARRK